MNMSLMTVGLLLAGSFANLAAQPSGGQQWTRAIECCYAAALAIPDPLSAWTKVGENLLLKPSSTAVRHLRKIAEGDDLIIAVAGSPTIFRSATGSTWSECEVSSFPNLYGNCFGKHLFVVVGNG